MSQMRLLLQRRFWPLFWTQFLGAFNDNLFKNALVILIAYRSMKVLGQGSETVVVACAGIFILPFFLFSATAGQLSDRFTKAVLMRVVKGWEIVVMVLAGIGFATFDLGLLLVVLFLMGLQSTFFGPAKYAVLPELLDERTLVGGNALVGMGTFLAILLGTITGGLVIAGGDIWVARLGFMVVAVAVAGLATSLAIPRTPPASPDLKVQLDPIRPSLAILRVTRRPQSVFLAIMGISWFWFLGVSFLSLLPHFSKDVVGGAETVVTLFLALFCIGIAVGSLLCERFSRRRLELGLVPLGSIGITLFSLDLAWAGESFPAPMDGSLLSVGALLAQPHAWRLAADLFLIAVFSGFYTVPLMTLVQLRSAVAERSRVIAGLNIINSGFMVLSSVLLVAMLGAGASIPGIFAILALLNALVAIYIYGLLPEFMLRFAAWCVANVMYRMRVEGAERVPDEGAAVLAPNHVSFVDWLVMAAACPRPVRFVMHHAFSRLPLVRFLFRDAGVIPIAGRREDPEMLARAMDEVASALESGEVVCIFPEGAITHDGELQPFRHGIERIVQRTPAPVLPVAIQGLWGSFFSRKGGKAMRRPFRRFWSRIEVDFGEPLAVEGVTAEEVAERVASLGGWRAPAQHEAPGKEAESPTMR
jgi:1-acyl-sn-glycerol-3-phosphate acyltransferase